MTKTINSKGFKLSRNYNFLKIVGLKPARQEPTSEAKNFTLEQGIKKPPKPHNICWIRVSGRLWRFTTPRQKLKKLGRSPKNTQPIFFNSEKVFSQRGWICVRKIILSAWANDRSQIIKPKSTAKIPPLRYLHPSIIFQAGQLITNLLKPQKPYSDRGVGRFKSFGNTLVKIEKLGRLPKNTKPVFFNSGKLFLQRGSRSVRPSTLISATALAFIYWISVRKIIVPAWADDRSQIIKPKSTGKIPPLRCLHPSIIFQTRQLITNLLKPQKPYSDRGVGRFKSFGNTPVKIEKLGRSLLSQCITRGIFFPWYSQNKQVISTKLENKYSPVNDIEPEWAFTGESIIEIIAKFQKFYKPCWNRGLHGFWEFNGGPPNLRRSLLGQIFPDWEFLTVGR